MVSELPGRNASEPIWPRKYCKPKAEPSLVGRRQHGASQETDAAKHFGGGGKETGGNKLGETFGTTRQSSTRPATVTRASFPGSRRASPVDRIHPASRDCCFA